jgi:hypothetical protein
MAISNTRFTAKPTSGPQMLHHARQILQRRHRWTAHYLEDIRTAVGPEDLLFAARRWDCQSRRSRQSVATEQHRHADKPSSSILPTSIMAPSSRG